MKVIKKSIHITTPKRGVYLITNEIEKEINEISDGIANIFLKHTSASLAINENYDPIVRSDIESFLQSLIPDCWEGFEHTLEGCDDMPAHMKNIFIGSSLTIPISNGRLDMGIWQGIYLLEHREQRSRREIAITLIGE